MAGNFYNNNDSVDISELAALNEDISDELIDQLQQQISQNIPAAPQSQTVNPNDDSTLFEEVTTQNNKENPSAETNAIPEDKTIEKANTELNDSGEQLSSEKSSNKENIEVNKNFDDNFIKKYKAKLQKKAMGGAENTDSSEGNSSESNQDSEQNPNNSIENLSQGNITELPMTKELKDYNDSLDFIDGNVKYSKYVIYIDPQNVDFIDGLTVKERKNLINGILRQQDDISITKKRFKVIQTVINHVIIAILTITISIPVVYYAINASLEATINNHRNAQVNWQVLYKSHGKITQGK